MYTCRRQARCFRYGSQGPLVQTAGNHQGGKLKTRLLPTLFNKDRKMILGVK